MYLFTISWWSPLGKRLGPSFERTWIPFTQGCFITSVVNISQVVLERKIFKFRQSISLFRYKLPLEKDLFLHLEETWIPYAKECFVPRLKLAKWFWRIRFWNFFNVNLLFCNYLLLEKVVALHLHKHESPLPKDGLCQVCSELAQ